MRLFYVALAYTAFFFALVLFQAAIRVLLRRISSRAEHFFFDNITDVIERQVTHPGLRKLLAWRVW